MAEAILVVFTVVMYYYIAAVVWAAIVSPLLSFFNIRKES